jgi:hypothetical protein
MRWGQSAGKIAITKMLQNPQRLYVGHSAVKQSEDIVRASQRCEESGRNDQIVPVCLNCGKILMKDQKKYCSKHCQGTVKCNIPKGLKIWNDGLTKEVCPKLSNSGVKKGNKPWNKNTEGLQIAWNIGLTKETDERVAKYGNSHKGHPCYDGSGNSKSGYRKDIGHFVRSTWEANFCRVLQYFGVNYKYEARKFDLGYSTYRPDIWLANANIYIEIKGYADAKWQKKLAAFKEKYPEENLIVISKAEYKEICKRFSEVIANWE